MKIIASTLTIICFCYQLQINAQDRQSVNFNINPPEAIVKIDGITYKSGNFYLQLDTGIHIIEMWAPKRKLIKDSIRVSNEGVNRYQIYLPYSENYREYQKELKQHNRKRTAINSIIPIASLAYFGIVYRNGLNNYDETLLELEQEAYWIKDTYDKGKYTSDFVGLKDDFEAVEFEYNMNIEARDKYIKNHRIILGTCAVLEIGLIIWSKYWQKPEYTENSLLSHLKLSTNNVRGIGTYGLTLNF